MRNEKLINEYFDGNLDSSNQEHLFEELSKSEDLRYDFNQQFAIKLAISKDIGAFVPRTDTSDRLFKSLGFGATGSKSKGAFFGNYGRQFLTGALASLATIIIMLWLFPYGNNLNSNDNNYIPSVSSYDIKDNQLTVELPKENNKDKTPKSDYLALNNKRESDYLLSEINKLEDENKRLKNTIEIISKAEASSDDNNKITSITPDDYIESISKKKATTNYNTVFESNFVNTSFENNIRPQENTYIINNYNNIDSESSIKLEAAIGRYFQNIGNEFIERNNTFSDNIRLTGLYKLNKEFAIGADLRQENFYQEFTATNGEGNEVFYQQQPIVYSAAILFRYYPIYLNFYNIRPSFDLSIGAANIGELARFGIGIDYSFFQNTYFYLKSDYTFLSFYHKNLSFSSDKFGTHIGVGIEF